MIIHYYYVDVHRKKAEGYTKILKVAQIFWVIRLQCFIFLSSLCLFSNYSMMNMHMCSNNPVKYQGKSSNKIKSLKSNRGFYYIISFFLWKLPKHKLNLTTRQLRYTFQTLETISYGQMKCCTSLLKRESDKDGMRMNEDGYALSLPR